MHYYEINKYLIALLCDENVIIREMAFEALQDGIHRHDKQ